MKQPNPYSAPSAPINDVQNDNGFGDLKILTSEGRIGRIRYLMYTLGIGLAGMLLASILFFIPLIGSVLVIATYVGIFVVSIFLTIQRSHDFNASGWMSLLLLIPVISLIFYVIPGTKGSNNYGLQPPPNSKALIITTVTLVTLFVLTLIGIMAIPEIDQYIQ